MRNWKMVLCSRKPSQVPETNLSLSVSPLSQAWRWGLAGHSSVPPVCSTSPPTEKPTGKVRMAPFLTEQSDSNLLAVISFCLELFG